MMPRPDFIELPSPDLAAAKAFYAQAFGWGIADYGPAYSCTTTGDVDVGLQDDPAQATQGPLVVIQVPGLDAAAAAVAAAGGAIIRPAFAFPGGRRFHFRDPNGNELAAWQPA